MTKYVFWLFLSLLVVPNAFAQKRKSKPRQTVVKHPKQLSLFDELLSSTARVLFVDSVVVDSADFFRHIPLSPASGTITSYNQFFQSNDAPGKTVNINEFGNYCLYAKGDSTDSRLYTKDKLGEQWSNARTLDEITSDYQAVNYPFLCTDGITLFFAAKGPKSLGGYDIFMTRYNSATNTFFTPENYGLPYNSEANDYLLAIDETDTLAWLATDRNQPRGKICIYTFEPSPTRVNIETTGLSHEQVLAYANLHDIKSTWQFGNREQALVRIKKMQAAAHTNSRSNDDIDFVINDHITYHAVNEFKSPGNRDSFMQLSNLKQQYNQLHSTLEAQRAAGQREHSQLSTEQQRIQMYKQIHLLEKKIRNTENLLMNK